MNETFATGFDTQNILDQLEVVLAALDALPGHEITALRIDEAIHALSKLADSQC